MTNKIRGGYSLDLRRQIRLRISTEMYDLLRQIANQRNNLNISKIIRYFLETGLEKFKMKKPLEKPVLDHHE
jgi:hypothetical protein